MADLVLTRNEQILRAEKFGGNNKAKMGGWSAVVHLVVVQASGLMAMDNGESSDPYCKICLGKERIKTKSISNTVNPKWREAFDLYWFEEFDHQMELDIYDKDVGSKDDFMGRYWACCAVRGQLVVDPPDLMHQQLVVFCEPCANYCY